MTEQTRKLQKNDGRRSPAGAGTNNKFLFHAHARSLLTPNWDERQPTGSICLNVGSACAAKPGCFLKTSELIPVQVRVGTNFAVSAETRGFF